MTLATAFEHGWLLALLFGHLLCLVGGLGTTTLLGFTLPEQSLRQVMKACGLLGLGVASLFALSVWQAEPAHDIVLAPWYQVGAYRYDVSLQVTGPGSLYAMLASVIFLAIVSFSGQYLHRDPGYQRFMLLVALMQLGVLAVCFARSFDLLFFGWELVGLCSVLLVGFFQDNALSAKQSLRALINYRIADVGIILAMLLLQHAHGEAYFPNTPLAPEERAGWEPWLLGLFLIFGSLGKSSQLPFAGWLPRAMEGPTPSSALFYGALSVHLGPLLLIKGWELWVWSPSLRLVLASIGGASALFAALTGRTQANVKGQLAYAVMMQLGLILVELAAGWYHLALLHICGHAALRTWQYLRSASILQDFHGNQAFHDRLAHMRRPRLGRLLPRPVTERLYVHAVQAFHLEAWQRSWLVWPLLRLSERLGRIPFLGRKAACDAHEAMPFTSKGP